jgi:hypothetical protein
MMQMLKQNAFLWLLAVCAVLVLLLPQAATAQTDGTLNLKSARAYEGSPLASGEVRFWESNNETIAVGVTDDVGDRIEGSITLLDIDVSGRDPVANVVRASKMRLLAADLKQQVSEGDWTVAINPGLEFALSNPTGTNTASGLSADWGDVIPTLGIVMERLYDDSTLIINPKMAKWRSSFVATNNQVVKGFGTVVGIGVGLRKPVSPRLQLSADITAIICGRNTVNENTNRVEKDLVWGIGASYLVSETRPTWLTVFTSNAFGPTGATSLLATPDNAACFGVRLDSTF